MEGIRALLDRLLSQPAARTQGSPARPVELVNNLVGCAASPPSLSYESSPGEQSPHTDRGLAAQQTRGSQPLGQACN